MIDCHAHLALPEFDGDRDSVLARAASAGVTRVLVVGEDLDDDRRVLEVCSRHAGVLVPCFGLHPDRFAEDRKEPDAEGIEAVVALARTMRNEIAAIGEIGLDHHYVKSDERRALQAACLERMAALGSELDLPLNVHSRSAGRRTLELLESIGARRVLMHAFDGKASHAKRAAERLGYVFSIPPSVVRSPQKQKLVETLPLEALTLESDSPVLGPVPGERNEPANLALALATIARLKGIDEERARLVLTQNAERLFAKPALANIET